MNTLRILICVFPIVLPGVIAASDGSDLVETLRPSDIVTARISFPPWGATLGFETEIRGDDPRIEPLTDLLRRATPGEGHKCANVGAVRFSMRDGRVVGVGLLPSHTAGSYDLRLYEGERFVGVYRVDRSRLLAVLGTLGVPLNDPAFRE